MPKLDQLQRIEISEAGQLREWLSVHHGQDEGVWLVTFKKHISGKYVSTSEVLDELLCFGWVDGARKKLDADRTMQLITPRRKHHWAKTYKDRADKLIAEGRMRQAGLDAIERSKQDGLWTFMDDVDALIMPDDLAKALADHPPAQTHYEAMPPSRKRFMLRWIKLAKTPVTRGRRIKQAAELTAQGLKIPGS